MHFESEEKIYCGDEKKTHTHTHPRTHARTHACTHPPTNLFAAGLTFNDP